MEQEKKCAVYHAEILVAEVQENPRKGWEGIGYDKQGKGSWGCFPYLFHKKRPEEQSNSAGARELKGNRVPRDKQNLCNRRHKRGKGDGPEKKQAALFCNFKMMILPMGPDDEKGGDKR